MNGGDTVAIALARGLIGPAEVASDYLRRVEMNTGLVRGDEHRNYVPNPNFIRYVIEYFDARTPNLT